MDAELTWDNHHVRTTLTQAEERSRIFNSREALFNVPMTEYTEIGVHLNKSRSQQFFAGLFFPKIIE